MPLSLHSKRFPTKKPYPKTLAIYPKTRSCSLPASKGSVPKPPVMRHLHQVVTFSFPRSPS